MEDRIAKMTGSLSQTEAEVSALRRAVVEQEHQRRTLESRLLEAAEASNTARSELHEQRQWLEQSGRRVASLEQTHSRSDWVCLACVETAAAPPRWC